MRSSPCCENVWSNFGYFSLLQGSFGQVVCAYDQERKAEVAIKIIKSRKPFLIQAKTEIDILNKINDKDDSDDSNIVRLLDHFMYRNHQCLVFEILSFNLYELLKNTKYAFFFTYFSHPPF